MLLSVKRNRVHAVHTNIELKGPFSEGLFYFGIDFLKSEEVDAFDSIATNRLKIFFRILF